MSFRLKVTFILMLFSFFAGKSHALCMELDSARFSNYDSLAHQVYKSLLDNRGLSFETFSYAYQGYWQLASEDAIEKKNILTIIDFNKPSTENRLFIIDLEKHTIIHESLVAHGRNSGWDIPESFSNVINSKKSSLGFFLTAETYTGKHGLSLKLDGLEKDINDNARKRHIVIHSADYVSNRFIDKAGRLGRSFGCPSLPFENYDKIIDLIKNKSLIFIYSNQKEYFALSEYL